MGRRSRLLAEKADPLLVFDMVKVLRRLLKEGGGRCVPLTDRELYTAFAHARKLLWLYSAPANKAGVQKWVPRSNPTNIKERLAIAGIDPSNWETEDELALTDELKLEWAIQHQVDEAIVKQERELKEKRRKAVKARAKAPRDEAMNGDAPPPVYPRPAILRTELQRAPLDQDGFAAVDEISFGEPVSGSCSPGSYFDDLMRLDEQRLRSVR